MDKFEATNTNRSDRQCKRDYAASGRGLSAAPKRNFLSLTIAAMLYGGVAYAADLPIPRAEFIKLGQGAGSYQFNGSNLTVNQQSERAIFNWDEFNVAEGNSVTFKQPSHTSVALNRIFDANPSQIFGAITANGQVYLFNQNGFVFGKTARVNVGALVASTLDVNDDDILNGSLLSAIERSEAAFFNGVDGKKIEVLEGAEIIASNPTGGQILMIAPEVINKGLLQTSEDGQVILAASKDSVFLTASDEDPNLRGLLVEVETGGDVTNLGSIIADQGNVSMIGLAVNQSGRIRATSSVSRNGSVRLLARDGATVRNTDDVDDVLLELVGIEKSPTSEKVAVASNSGSVVLGEGSEITIALDLSDDTKVSDGQVQLKSQVEISGKEIWLQKDSHISATSGDVRIRATESPGVPGNTVVTRDDSYVYMDEGSVIDVSGADDALLAMERNSLAVEVRSNELADSPVQRGGVLDGSTLYVDLRKGTELIDYSGALSNVEKGLSERMADGGNIDITSNGDFVQRDGALLDVSGGKVTYASGFIRESKLISDFRIYDLSDASKYRKYDAVLGDDQRNHDRWAYTQTFDSSSNADKGHYVDSFIEGKAAGNVNISAASALLSADGIKADTVIGPYQRQYSRMPGSSLVAVDLRYKSDSTQGVSFLAESLVEAITDDVANNPDTITYARGRLSGDMILPDSYASRAGAGKLKLTVNGDIVIEQGATLVADKAGSFDFTAANIDVVGDIVTHGGDVDLTAIAASGTTNQADITVSQGSTIDTTGNWINESLVAGGADFKTPLLIDGGDIRLQAAGDIALAEGSLLDASGGAMLDRDAELIAGAGGDISIIGTKPVTGSSVRLDGVVQSYALNDGGDFELQAAGIAITDDENYVASLNQSVIDSAFFQQGGFEKYKFTASSGDFIVDTIIEPIAQNYVLSSTAATSLDKNAAPFDTSLLVDTGTPFDEIALIETLPDHLRNPVDIEFSLAQSSGSYVEDRLFEITSRGGIKADTAASVAISSDTSIHHGGIIETTGGDVRLTINKFGAETGYIDTQGIWLASGSRINATSGFIQQPNKEGLIVGDIIDAGSVTLSANRGHVVMQDGAVIDVSAKEVMVDQLVSVEGVGTTFDSVPVAPDAGHIKIESPEAIVLDGEIFATAANRSGRGGSLDIDFNERLRAQDPSQLGPGQRTDFHYTARDIVITENSADVLSAGAHAGDSLDSINGTTRLDIADLKRAGFSDIKLKTAKVRNDVVSEIRFDRDVQWSVDNALVLDTRIINAADNHVAIDAGYVRLGATDSDRNDLVTPLQAGDGVLGISASLIDAIGDIDVHNASKLALVSDGEVRLIGQQVIGNDEQLTGSLTTSADIDIVATMLYPVTNSDYVINLNDNVDGVVRVTSSGVDRPVLSAGGTLTVNAPVIEQAGIIKAPLGNIALNASDTVRLLPGSITSVSADELTIPYGLTENQGTDWLYSLNPAHPVAADLSDKSVELAAPTIDVQDGATVDLSGGGDLVAWEFAPGPLGSSDVLAADDGSFAILPDLANQYAPYDFLLDGDNFENNFADVGRSIRLSGGDGIAAGSYTVLPARYALLPGAKLITPQKDVTGIRPEATVTRADGAQIVAGKFGIANSTTEDSNWSAFVVEEGSVARTRSQYFETFASTHFDNQSPADAGALVVDVQDSLSLAGNIIGNHAEGSRGSRVDILSDKIEVVAANAVATNGYIQLQDSDLNALNVDSLMLGGRRSITADGVSVAVASDDVVLRQSADVALPEVMLVSKGSIELESHSTLRTVETTGSSASGESYALDNNGSIVAVSNNALSSVTRSGAQPASNIIIAENATIAATKSMIIDASGDVEFNGNHVMDGGSLRLGAGKVNLGDVPVTATGFNLSSDVLSALNVEQLVISSVDSIALYEDINLSFNNLELNTAGIDGISTASGATVLTASGSVVLRHNGNASSDVGSGSNSLSIDAAQVTFAGAMGSESFVVSGFDAVDIAASESVSGQGTSSAGFDFNTADVVIDTPLIRGAGNSDLIIHTAGNVLLDNSSALPVMSAVDTLNDSLVIDANRIDVDTRLAMPSGQIWLTADDDLVIAENALLDVSGRVVDFVDGSRAGSSAGTIELTSGTGSLDTRAGAVIDLSASPVAGDAGNLILSAINGSINLGASFDTSTTAGFNGASITTDTGTLADTADYVARVQAGGFSYQQNYRLRNGDFDIPVLANNATNMVADRLSVSADNGSINLSGKLDASGDSAGKIELFASDDVNLAAASIVANASTDIEGGQLILGSANGNINVDVTTTIDVSGVAAANTGSVTLRAPRAAANTDIAVLAFDAIVTGAAVIKLEGVAIYNDSTIGSAQQTLYRNEADSWLANAAAISSRLGLGANARYLPGVEVVNNGDISINSEIDFYQWQEDTLGRIDSGLFTVRATGNLNINKSISDAVKDGKVSVFSFLDVPLAQAGDSWGYRLTSGADLGAANPMAYIRDASVSTTLADKVTVRTGNGGIEVASGGDLVLVDQSSVIYTVGSDIDLSNAKHDVTFYDFGAAPDGLLFSDNGGDIRLTVAGDIDAAVSDQYFTDWLQRVAEDPFGNPDSATWGVVLKDFEQGIATLGGGDIEIYAGGDINNLSLSTPQTGLLELNDEIVLRGGGDIEVIAGGSYHSAKIFADGGVAAIRVAGDVAARNNVDLDTVVALGNGSLDIEAGGDIVISGIGNVSMIPMSKLQVTNKASQIYFFTYQQGNSVDLLSRAGEITLKHNVDDILSGRVNKINGTTDEAHDFMKVYPGSLSITTLSGDINLDETFTLFPDAQGSLTLLANGDIGSASNSKYTSIVSDSDVASLPDAVNPDRNNTTTVTHTLLTTNDDSTAGFHRVAGPLHSDDSIPVIITANQSIGFNEPAYFRLPKETLVTAGDDIINLDLDIQNIAADDHSRVIAGGDIRYPLPDIGSAASVSSGMRVSGPGRFDVIAGGTVDLGQSEGIRSLGNVNNPALVEQGADLTVLSGVNDELDTSAFISTYLLGQQQGEAALIDIDVSTYQQRLIAFISSEEFGGDLETAVSRVTSDNYTSREQVLSAFNLLDDENQLSVALESFTGSSTTEQRNLLLGVMFNEIALATSNQAKTGEESEYARGFLAINTLFGDQSASNFALRNQALSSQSQGADINLQFSRIYSAAGGDINLAAPNGSLKVGFSSDVSDRINGSDPAGVVINGQGNLSAMTDGNIEVNLSRVLALDGGDIILWSSAGDIDAGRGAKTALVIPPPVTSCVNGLCVTETQPPVSGSGIGSTTTTAGLADGGVFIAAPGGVVNASDAGIRSDGDIAIAATEVLGGDNISAGGTAVGIPVATNVTAGLSGLSSSTDNAVSGATDSVSSSAAGATNNEGVALVTVELLGAGESF